MDFKEPNITVITNVPNDGHAAMVFTDKGVCLTAACKSTQLYDGVITLMADMIVDANEDYSEEDIAKYISEINGDVQMFVNSLVSAISKNITEKLMDRFESDEYDTLLEMLRDGLHSQDD